MNADNIRKRTVEEDTLLGSRTTAFLIGNGFVLTALGANPEPSYKLVIAVFGLLVSVLWMMTTLQSYRAIQVCHRLRLELEEVDEINDAVSAAMIWKVDGIRRLLGPTALVAVWLPSIVTMLWVVINGLMLIAD